MALNLLRHRDTVFDGSIDEIYYCYDTYQEIFDQFLAEQRGAAVKFVFHQGPLCDFPNDGLRRLVVYDDLLAQINDSWLARLFTVVSHHHNLSTILITHSLFYNKPGFREASRNCTYYFLLRSFRMVGQVNYLARTLFMNDKRKQRRMVTAFNDATKNHGYLLLDLHRDSDDRTRLRTCILPTELRVHRKYSLIKTYPM
jgi:hypothetical protein